MVGRFIEDKLDGSVEYDDVRGNKFQSEQEKDQESNANKGKKGSKMMTNESGDFTNKHGSFINGRLYHLGIVNYLNGDKFKGNFKDGRPCG